MPAICLVASSNQHVSTSQGQWNPIALTPGLGFRASFQSGQHTDYTVPDKDLYTPFEGPGETGKASQLGRLAMDLTPLVLLEPWDS